MSPSPLVVVLAINSDEQCTRVQRESDPTSPSPHDAIRALSSAINAIAEMRNDPGLDRIADAVSAEVAAIVAERLGKGVAS